MKLSNSLDQAKIEKEGAAPSFYRHFCATGNERESITYQDQETAWKEKKPVLIVLGTARGLAPRVYVQHSQESCAPSLWGARPIDRHLVLNRRSNQQSPHYMRPCTQN
jgi:hypothetical protein